jgi:cob(I)alamin adenosyltransferase
MKIYTKKGDTGETGLIGGTRVPKCSLRIESYGTVDELNSYVGLIRDQDINELYKTQLIEIQDRLFTIGSSLASDPEKSSMKIPDLIDSDIKALENWMDEMEE